MSTDPADIAKDLRFHRDKHQTGAPFVVMPRDLIETAIAQLDSGECGPGELYDDMDCGIDHDEIRAEASMIQIEECAEVADALYQTVKVGDGLMGAGMAKASREIADKIRKLNEKPLFTGSAAQAIQRAAIMQCAKAVEGMSEDFNPREIATMLRDLAQPAPLTSPPQAPAQAQKSP